MTLIKPPFVGLIANDKGGVGKSTFTLTLIDLLILNGMTVHVIQVDEQERLSTLLGAQVQRVVPHLEDARRDPKALMAAYAPIYHACAAAVKNTSAVAIEIGANQLLGFAEWLKAVDLDEDLRKWSLPVVTFAVAPGEIEAVRKAAAALETFREVLPWAHRVFVENRYGQRTIKDLAARQDTATIVRKELLPALKGAQRLMMPAVEADSWAACESAGIRFIKAIAMKPDELAQRLGEDVANVKVMRGDLARFFKAMHGQLSQVFELPKGGE
jgi:hypothetical protein